jgi:pSer/pThr/pTyr-binding forkhead associated (FHA) protein
MTPTTVAATLRVIHAADRGLQDKAFPLEREVTIGRGEENTLVVDSDQASRRHASIRPEAGGHLLADLGSTNGTFVNSKAVKERRLVDGDVIRVASTVLKYQVG